MDEANFVKNGSIAGMFRAAGSNTFNFKYKIGKKTVIFGVPKDKTAYDEYTLLSAASFKDNYTYSGYAYDANYVNVPNVIVADLLDKAQNLDENIICVDRVITALNREKEGIKKIIGVQNGQNIEYNCISGIGDNVKAGDIIRVATNNQNAVELVLVICNVLSQATPGSTGASEYTMQNGYVYAATDEALVYRKSDGTIDELTQSFTPENVTLLYDSISREPKFQKATTEEVISERDNPIMKSFVFTYRRNGYVINTIIVK